MKWQATIPTRAQIEAHRANGGVWLVCIPTRTPLPWRGMTEGEGFLWPALALATFRDVPGGAIMQPNRGDSKEIPEASLGGPSAGEGRGAWHFAPVVMDDGDYTFQPAGEVA